MYTEKSERPMFGGFRTCLTQNLREGLLRRDETFYYQKLVLLPL